LFVRYREVTEEPPVAVPDTWIAKGDGSGQRMLIKDAQRPTWSPDRKQIAFFRGGNLWRANADGTEQEQLTTRWTPDDDGCSNMHTPGISWGPVPGRIAFSRPEEYEVRARGGAEPCSYPGSAAFEVLLNAAPHEVRDLLDATVGLTNTCPAWSPSGEHLVWAHEGDIWLARRDTKNASLQYRQPYPWSYTRLAAVAHYDYATDHCSMWGHGATHLAWSPDGKLLAYGMVRYGGSGIAIIRIMRLKRSDAPYSFINLEVVKDWLVTEQGRNPCFSPDGSRLIYEYWPGIHISTLDGKWHHPLIEDGEQPCL
jgi:Tol biopolymer transport system component